MQAVINANKQALEQILSLIACAKGDVYSKVPQGMTSAIGRHVRHVLDHYNALQVGIENNEIDYDLRSRDSEVETDSCLAVEKINGTIEWMKENIQLDSPMQMKTEVSLDCQEGCVVESTLQREMVYLLNHTVHHVAYITLVLRTLGISVDEHVGIAPATQSYNRSNNNIKQVG